MQLHYNYFEGFRTLLIWNIMTFKQYNPNTKIDNNVRSYYLKTVLKIVFSQQSSNHGASFIFDEVHN